MDVSATVWMITIGVLAALLAVDLFVIGRRPHVPSLREAGLAIAVFLTLGALFGAGIWAVWGPAFAGQYYTGWIIEYSLSVDNLFIFVVIMSKFRVPRELQQFALMVGIMLALVFRGIFIALGTAFLAAFTWAFLVFGAFLIYTALKLYVDYRKGDDEEFTENAVLGWVRKTFPASPDYHSTAMVTRVDGRRFMTPMLIVVIALGSTDLLFALDSIPAIFGVTQEPFLVFTANVFALMGLRQLYFMIGGLLDRLVYLSVGLAVILGFIGIKMVLEFMRPYGLTGWLGPEGEMPIWVSLVVIVVVLAVTTVASLWSSRRSASAEER